MFGMNVKRSYHKETIMIAVFLVLWSILTVLIVGITIVGMNIT